MWRHLFKLSLAEWRHHPWRHGVAMLAVALGVALASSVQMINESALSEFGQAVRSVNGQPDAVLSSAGREGLADTVFAQLATDPAVAVASPVLEINSRGRRPAPEGEAPHQAVGLSILGVDALQVARIVPDLLPQAQAGSQADRLAMLAPDAAFLNAAATKALGAQLGDALQIQSGSQWISLKVRGHVAASGPPVVVMDIAGAQQQFNRPGLISRVDVKLWPGTDVAAWQAHWLTRAQPPLPANARWAQADETTQRMSNFSRAYRVNLGVLAGVALLVGGFLVYSVVSLSVAQRTPALALLGVLGLAAQDRRRLVLAESAVVGLVGSALGLAAGAALAHLALQLLGGDLGGGYFSGGAPQLAWPWSALVACGVLGVLAAVAGAWWPARQAERLSPAMALKGLGSVDQARVPRWPALALLTLGVLLALAPPVGGLPLAAYAAVGSLLAGGVVGVPVVVQWLLQRQSHPRNALVLLALRRARFARQTASATVAGVVASLALSVAITVMVASFREAVIDWLQTALPADLYARSAGSAAATEQVFLPPDLVARLQALPGVARVLGSRQLSLPLQAQRPAVALVTRDFGDQAPGQLLPLVGDALPAKAGELDVYVSEPAAALYGWHAGDTIVLPVPAGTSTRVRVRGVWRDYARQSGAIAMDSRDYLALTGDARLNDLAIWLAPGASAVAMESAIKAAAGPDMPLELASTAALRQLSLKIFDRSFAVTVYLQAVAIGVGLVGVAASLSAQVLARRKEFGLLAHLGLTRRQVMAVVGAEAATWLAAGALIGLVLGLAMAVVLVKVVNPQSFHWSMPLHVPAARLATLAAAVLAAGIATALWSARRAASAAAVQAVKEDW
jgi:putative ABC transport system permease protein